MLGLNGLGTASDALTKTIIAVMILLGGVQASQSDKVKEVFNRKQQEIQQQIKEEVQELQDDYETYEVEFAKVWVDNYNPDVDLNSIEFLDDMRDFSIDTYTQENEYSNLTLSDKTIDKLYNDLTEGEQGYIRNHVKYGNDREETVIRIWLKKKYDGLEF